MKIIHIREHLKQICYVSIDNEFGTIMLLNQYPIEICILTLRQFELISSEYSTLQIDTGHSNQLLYRITSK